MRTQPIPRIALLAPAVLLAACAGDTTAEVRTVGAYDSARIDGATSATLTGPAELSADELEIACDQDVRDVEADVVDGQLTVTVAPAGADCEVGVYGPELDRLALQTAEEGPEHIELVFNADADVTLSELDAPDVDIAVGGGAVVAVDRIVGDTVAFDMTGGGQLMLGTVDAAGLAVQTNGTSAVEIASLTAGAWTVDAAGTTDLWAEGEVDEAFVTADGDSYIDALAVTAEDADVVASGSSYVGLTVEESVSIDATGQTTVEIGGDPAGVEVDAGSSAEIIGL